MRNLMDHIAADLKNSALMPNHVAVQTIASGKRPKSLLLANDKSFHKMLDRITPGLVCNVHCSNKPGRFFIIVETAKENLFDLGLAVTDARFFIIIVETAKENLFDLRLAPDFLSSL